MRTIITITAIIVVLFAVLAPKAAFASSKSAPAISIIASTKVTKPYDATNELTFSDGVSCSAVIGMSETPLALGPATVSDKGTWFWWSRTVTDKNGATRLCQ